jgi:GTPase SAR1 family protein
MVLVIQHHEISSVYTWNIDFDTLQEAVIGGPQIHYTNAKAVLVGETSAGKTCLARALMRKQYKPQESTHGMKVWNFDSETVSDEAGGKVTREIMLWDLAGQPDYRVVHQLFLDETILGVVMFDPTDPDDPFHGVGHWEKALCRVAGEDCPRIL